MLRPFIRLLALVLTCLCAAYAASGVSIDISRAELYAQPGQSVSFVLTVSDPQPSGEAPLAVRGYLNDFVLPQTGAARFVSPGSVPSSLAGWLRFAPETFSLAPGARQQVRYTVQVPAGAKPGLYWGVLFFSGNTPAASSGTSTSVAVNTQLDIGHIVYVQVGSPDVQGHLTEVSASSTGGRVSVQAQLKNTGNALIRAAGSAQLRDMQGKLIASVPIGESVALPGYSRTFEGSAAAPLKGGKYLLLVSLTNGRGQYYTGQTTLSVP